MTNPAEKAGGSERATVVVFARVGELTSDSSRGHCPLPRHAVDLLRGWGGHLVLVSAFGAGYVRGVQRDLQIHEAFVCEGGAALHVPAAYRGNQNDTRAKAAWETFRFNPPDKFAAVLMARDLFVAVGWHDVLTIGVGCDLDDYGLLAAVELPVVVRDLRKDQSGLLRYVPGAYLTNATGADGWTEAVNGP